MGDADKWLDVWTSSYQHLKATLEAARERLRLKDIEKGDSAGAARAARDIIAQMQQLAFHAQDCVLSNTRRK